MSSSTNANDPAKHPNAVAIIGMACRLPGANDPDAFWENLRDGVESLSYFTDEELLASGIDPSWLQHPDYVRANAILSDVTSFDADFFGLSPREAEIMDPQERIMLECAWEALEDAGYPPAGAPGRVSVFAGARFSEYLANNQDPIDQVGLTTESPLLATHRHWVNDKDFLATRVSYHLDLTGPSMTVQTACSTSLVAIHLACRSLLSGESDMALAGGVTIRVPQKAGHLFNEGMIFSSDGHTRTFDAQADGTIFSSGAGVVVLKRLDRALADGDLIRAVILGTAVNNDGGGETKTRYAAPSTSGQASVIRDAIAAAQVDPATITYVEAHGTATQIGDPIEFDGLVEAFRTWTDGEQFCALGSVKSNIGHTVQAAGVAGVIKVALMFEHGALVPTLHFSRPNPRLRLDGSPFFINTAHRPWDISGMPRRAGISSFGVGGTNAHVILEEPPLRALAETGAGFPALFALSARDETALRALAGRHAAHLARRPDLALPDVCFTAAAGRSHFDHRLAVLPGSAAELQAALAAFAGGEEPAALLRGRRQQKSPPVAFLFTGQGAQYPGMGRELYEREPVFRRTIDECVALLEPHLDVPLTDVLFPPDESSAARIHETAYTQPALFAFEYALAQLWRSWGIEPAFVLGHSVGEYVAACLAGVFSLADGLRLIAERGRLIQALPQDGEMLAVLAGFDTAAAAAAAHPGDVSIAAVNGPENVVLSGRREAIAAIRRSLEAAGVETRPLRTSHAFHSPLMDPVLDAFEQFAGTVAFSSPAIPLISNVTGQQVDPGQPLDAAYWRRHLREAVRFADGLTALAGLGCKIFLEIGPQPTLIGMGRSTVDGEIAWLPSMRKGQPEAEQMHAALAGLYCRGIDPRWEDVAAYAARRRVPLPTYAFQRKRLWIEPSSRKPVQRSTGAGHPLLGQRLASPLAALQFSALIDASTPAFLQDHRVFDAVTVPATAYVEMAHAAAVEFFRPDGDTIAVEDLSIQQACLLAAGEARRLHLILEPEPGRSAAFRIFSAATGPEGDWIQHASGRLLAQPEAPAAGVDLAAIRSRCREPLAVDAVYAHKRERGVHHGPAFQGLREIRLGDAEALARVALPAVARTHEAFHVHPALLDACIQTGMAAFHGADAGDDLYLPIAWDRITFHAPVETSVWCHARSRTEGSDDHAVRTVDFTICAEDGRLLAAIEGLHFKRAARGAFFKSGPDKSALDRLYRIVWETVQVPQPASSGSGPQRVLIFTDETGAGTALACGLEAGGAVCVQIRPGPAYTVDWQGGEAQIVPAQAPDFARLLAEAVRDEERPFDAIVYLWGLAEPTRPDMPVQDLEAGQSLAVQGLLHLMQAIPDASHAGATAPTIWIVTRGAQPAGPQPGPFSIGPSSLWGLGRVFAGEHPEFDCRLIDLDPAEPPQEVQPLIEELRLPGEERQLAFRGEARLAPRLVRHAAAPPPDSSLLRLPAERPYKLVSRQAGTFDGLALVPSARRAPGPGEIEIRVRATGLNFRDVLIALGRFEDVLGRECAGIVAATGAQVTEFKVGDAVMAAAPDSFAEYVTVPAHHAAPMPRHLGFEEAATIPMAFLTAYHGLHNLAKMRRGDKVLIHAAAGGVGHAAIQLARAVGAEVFATASRRKWPYLRAMGIRHVLDSRSLDFAGEVMRLTEGRGVDIVLNSLAGEFIPRSIEVLAEKGRFIEIGATDVWDTARVAAVRADVEYHWFHLGQSVAARDPELFQSSFREVVEALEAGTLRPLPHVRFDISEARQAFRMMSQARHIGKVVVVHPESVQDQPIQMDPARTYLLTGAFGGLGLKVMDWLAARGARNLALVSRRAPEGEAAALLAKLEAGGVRAAVVQADVADWEALSAQIGPVLAEMPPLGGVIHMAGVLDDGLLQQQTWERFVRVQAPKVSGAWNLHRLVGDRPLEFFVLFSSVASIWGNPGQGNYAAGNAFMDALAHYRRARGLAAISINWGAWAEVGMAADLGAAVERRRSAAGLDKIDPEEGLELLARILNGDEAQVAVIPIDWSKFSPSANGSDRFFSRLRQAPAPAPRSAAMTPAGTDLAGRLEDAAPDERQAVMVAYLIDQVAKIVGVGRERLTSGHNLAELGVDSLMAVELRNRIVLDLDVQIPMSGFLRNPDLASLAANLLESRRPAAGQPAVAGEATDPLLVRLQAEGDGRPFFCVHGFGGGVLGYGDLARLLGRGQPFYGIRAAGLDGDARLDETIADMAARYLRAIRTVQAEGPYDLGGYCLGGVVAYEMARQLQAEGEAVGLVAIVEGYVPDALKARAQAGLGQRIAAIWRNVPYWVQDYADLGWARLRRRVMRRVRGWGMRAAGREAHAAPQDVVDDDLGMLPENQLHVMSLQIRANQEYPVEPYAGRVTVFRASGQTVSKALFGSLDPTLGWGRYAGSIDVIDVAGGHRNLHLKPHVESLARGLGDALRRSRSGG